MPSFFYKSGIKPRSPRAWAGLEDPLRTNEKDVLISRLEMRSIRAEKKIDEIGYMVAAINSGMAANGMYRHMGVEGQVPEINVGPRKPVGFGS